MSRRVFDVGLDVSRIKNGLKINRESKRNKTIRAAPTPPADDSYHLDQQLAIIPHLQNKESSSNIAILDDDKYRNHEAVHLPSPKSPEPAMHRGFPCPPSHRSSSPVSADTFTKDPHENLRLSVGDPTQNFDLRPPPPNKPTKFLDTLGEDLLSGEHLSAILCDPSYFLRFTAFLNRYKPQSAPILIQYLEGQKAIKAIEYANALAQTMKLGPGDSNQTAYPAASVDPRFEANSKEAFEKLVTEALPAYVTHCLVKVVTESMVREITGTTMPIMRELVGGLAEVFCLSDPSAEGNPIVYASEEFYRTSQYGRDYSIGRNCRFLQGPKTDTRCVARLSAAIKAGQEICETILNYRRDGSPFMNLLMIAPLYDNRGTVRYYIGAQVDVSGLIEDGRGLDSFASCLEDRTLQRQRENEQAQESASKRTLRKLNELGQMLSPDESSLFQTHSRPSSVQSKSHPSPTNYSMRSTTATRDTHGRRARKVLGNDNQEEDEERGAWPLYSMGPSGKLPGVYQNYFLVRPYPSLRIIFVSAALRIPGLLQTPLLSRIGGPSSVRDGLLEAFKTGTPVTAKIVWLPQGQTDDTVNGEHSRPGSRRAPGSNDPNPYSVINLSDGGSKTRYISCTPLFGSDDQVGVWMIVMVENEQVTGGLVSRDLPFKRYNEVPPTQSEYERESSEYGRANGLKGDADELRRFDEFLKKQGRGTLRGESDINEGEREGLMDGILGVLGDRATRL